MWAQHYYFRSSTFFRFLFNFVWNNAHRGGAPRRAEAIKRSAAPPRTSNISQMRKRSCVSSLNYRPSGATTCDNERGFPNVFSPPCYCTSSARDSRNSLCLFSVALCSCATARVVIKPPPCTFLPFAASSSPFHTAQRPGVTPSIAFTSKLSPLQQFEPLLLSHQGAIFITTHDE